ncbi:MAG: ABC transporter ATP-binding protein [Planctomycetes bacterium]|nr:ABC transporter ATP-binding protein [Planctomycetota bacterium]
MGTTSARGDLIRTESLGKVFADGQVQALIDVNVGIAQGEFTTILGPSGSGKSTLLGILGGLDQPTTGQVLFEGKPLSSMRNLDDFRTRKIGFVFQSFLLLPTLTARENIQIPMFEGPLRGSQRVEKATQLLEAVGLAHRSEHLPSQLSVGERQRVAIARALANDPPLILADEPTGNLDSRTAQSILDLFSKLHEERGLTLIVVTHWEPLVDYATRVIRLKDGRVASDEYIAKPLRSYRSVMNEGLETPASGRV